uniref:RPRD1A/B C-terminal domain-containing protein n=1 Tax=Callorhinchus milii TaxID=7868 RepID=A0A4W3GDJ7_CALMI
TVPQSLIEQLGAYKLAVDEREFKEEQLSTLRVDVCSTETLKRLKDRAGGKRFSKDFEESSLKLEDFCAELDREVKRTPPLIEALENAEIFYEAQYKEVKIVVNAYKTFANRVNNLKKKLDQMKSTLPEHDESPILSPCMDAPSPNGSESPMRQTEVIEVEMSPGDNCAVEDMELSDDEGDADTTHIIEPSPTPTVSISLKLVKAKAAISTSVETPRSKSAASGGGGSVVTSPQALPNLVNIDLGKISSILSSLTSAMKNTGQ